MYYSDEIIDNVLSASNIVDVISDAVHLEKRGANYFGLCPFHNEKTPSFCVSPSKQMYYCFGCHEGGNAFTFLQHYENMNFSEAVESLAARYSVSLPVKSFDPKKVKEARDEKSLLLEINKEAALWFVGELKGDRGSKGLEYLKNRGLSDATIRHFGLGFAPLSKDALISYLNEKGYKTQDIVKAGLAVEDSKSTYRDKFWNRVMFPIMDAGRRVIGFGGRVMGEGEPKYLNSPETPVFDKGRNLYGLCFAKNARKGRLILCEGYMDVIAMHQAGFTEAVASLGTAFTGPQALILKRYADDIILSYDSDEAGIRAALRAITILRETGLKGKILRLEPHKDPDEFIKKEGAHAFDERVRGAENSFYFEVSVDEKNFDLSDPAGLTSFQQSIAARLAGTFSDALERDNYLRAVCARYHIEPQAMRDAVARIASGGNVRAGRDLSAERVRGSVYVRDEKKRDEAYKTRRILLSLLTEDGTLIDKVKKYISPEDFCDPLYIRLAYAIFENGGNEEFKASKLLELFETDDEKKEAARALNEEVPRYESVADEERVLKDILSGIIELSGKEKLSLLDSSDTGYLAEVVAVKKRLENFKRNELIL